MDFSPSDAHSLAKARLRPSTPLNRCRLPLTSRTSPSGGTRLTRGVKRCAHRASRSSLLNRLRPVDSIRCTPTQSSVEVTVRCRESARRRPRSDGRRVLAGPGSDPNARRWPGARSRARAQSAGVLSNDTRSNCQPVRPSRWPCELDRAACAAPALQERDAHAFGFRLDRDAQDRRGRFLRSALRTKQDAECLASLGSELQAANRTGARTSRRPRQSRYRWRPSRAFAQKPRAARCARFPRWPPLRDFLAGPRWGFPRWPLGRRSVAPRAFAREPRRAR